MIRRSMAFAGAAFVSMGLLLGCGGNVSLSSGSGGSGGGTATSTGGASTTGTAGAGGATVTTTITDTPSACTGLDHVSCLQAFPSCVPVYDDKCCPTCAPTGGCADCVNLDFDHCASYSEGVCGGQTPPCGQVPDWACGGGQASCPALPDGSPEPCHSVAGCIAAYCSLDGPPCAGPVCHPATENMCSAICNSLPPTCGPNQYAETDGSCYTGYCIDIDLCVIPLGG